MKEFFCILACAALFAACGEREPGPGQEPPELVFGVMSDTHLGAPALSGKTPEERLIKAYEKFTGINPSMDAIITAGDFSDDGKEETFRSYKAIMDRYSTAKNNLLSMGNHDNYDLYGITENLTGTEAEKRFKDVFGFEPRQDKVINGYHFITVSTRDGAYNTTSYQVHKAWLEERLEKANAEDPHKPIFVFIHHTMDRTKLIGSKQAEAKGSGDLYDVFAKYPQVVTFSGHSHVSTMDPRNIWQGDYTALNCGSALYTALDFTHDLTAGRTANAITAIDKVENLTAQVPNNRGESSTALVVEVKGTKVTVRRIDNYWDKEIPAKFEFDTSLDKSDFPYREEKRKAASVAPEFASGAAITVDTANGVKISFPHAATNSSTVPDDGAFIYKVGIKNTATGTAASPVLLQAEYFMLPRPTAVSYEVKNLDPETNYEVSVIPVGYFGKEGPALTKTFKTGAPPAVNLYPIPVASFPGSNMIPATGITMDMFIGMLVPGQNLASANTMLGGGNPIFYQTNSFEQPFTGSDLIYSSTIIYSLIPPEMLLSQVGG